MSKRLALQLVLGSICLYHLFMGVGAFLSEDITVWLAEAVFSIKLHPTPQLSYVIKLLGVYVILFGLMSGVATLAPERYPVLLNLVIVLYVLRVLNKLVFSDLFTQAFDAPPLRTWIDLGMLAGFGIAVALLKPRPGTLGGA